MDVYHIIAMARKDRPLMAECIEKESIYSAFVKRN